MHHHKIYQEINLYYLFIGPLINLLLLFEDEERESPNRFSKVFKLLTTLLYILLFPYFYYFIIYVFIYFIFSNQF
jgi:hypothetical protein